MKLRVEQPRELPAPSEGRLERLQRAFDNELAAGTSLNVRGSTIGSFSVIALILSSQFASTWLDDSHWHFGGLGDWLVTKTFYVSGGAFALCVLASLWAIAPRSGWRPDELDRVTEAVQGSREAEADILARMVERQRVRNDHRNAWIRVASILMAIAVVAATAQGLTFAIDADIVDQRPAGSVAVLPAPPENAALPDGREAELVRRYAPVVYLHPREEYLPMDPEAFLAHSRLTWRERRGRMVSEASPGSIDAARLGRECTAARKGCYDNAGYLAEELTRPFTEGERARGLPLSRGFALDLDDTLRRGTGISVPFWYEVGVRVATGELRITYWFFYGFSVPYRPFSNRRSGKTLVPVRHEGDWENIDVVLDRGNLHPRRVEFYGHGAPHRVAWKDVERIGPGIHPVVYSARNSHASYAMAAPKATKANKICLKLRGRRTPICSWELRDRGPRWAPWEHGSGGLRNARTQPWYGFGGAWGRAGGGPESTGPLGPSHWKLPND